MSEFVPVTSDQVAAALTELGDNPAAVASALKSRGVTGLRDQARACPVANYLQQRFHTPADVSPQYITVGLAVLVLSAANLNTYTGILPRAIREFVLQFDGGSFGELVAPMAGLNEEESE